MNGLTPRQFAIATAMVAFWSGVLRLGGNAQWDPEGYGAMYEDAIEAARLRLAEHDGAERWSEIEPHVRATIRYAIETPEYTFD